MPQANQRVGEYVLDALLGGGMFGQVWRAHHHAWSDQIVAVKIPLDAAYLRNLQKEGVAIHGLSHPNIVRAIAFDPYAEVPYLVMEYVPGSSLRPLIAGKKIAVNDAVLIMRQVLAGLSLAHAQGLIHRDVKPENILVHERVFKDGFGAEGVIKITDFGLGKARAGLTGSIALSTSLAGEDAKEIAGSLDYMAPEQRSGGDIDARVDLYAAGIVFFEMLTGERPAGTDLPSDLNPAVPKNLDEVFRRSYARLDKRYASADEFLAALKPVAPTPPPIPPPVIPPPLRNGPTIGTGAICPRCRQNIGVTDQFCMHCGVQLAKSIRRCPRCGAFPDITDRYCIFCGETIDGNAKCRMPNAK